MVGSMGQEEVGNRVKGDKVSEVHLLVNFHGLISWVMVFDSTFHPFSQLNI